MLMKNILAAFALAGLAIATPVEEDIQERQAGCPADQSWCCVTATNLNIFFIRGVGSNCRPNNPVTGTCSTTGNPVRSRRLCCTGHQIVDTKSGNSDIVCTA